MATRTPAPARRKPRKAPAARTAAKPAARVVVVGGRAAGAPPAAQRRQVTPGQAARAPVTAAQTVTARETRYSAKHMLTAELLLGVLIVAVRAVADYEPQADGTLKGKIGHPKGQYGPLPILAGLIVSFFALSFLAAAGGTKAKLAVIFGGTIDLALLMNSSAEFEKVTATFGEFGKAKPPPGSWQTTGTEAGAAIQGSLSGGLVPGQNGGVAPGNPPGPIPVPASGKCPAGYTRSGGKCWPNEQGGTTQL